MDPAFARVWEVDGWRIWLTCKVDTLFIVRHSKHGAHCTGIGRGRTMVMHRLGLILDSLTR